MRPVTRSVVLAAAVAAAVTAAPAPAAAVPYELFIDIETEEDLYDLLAAEQIDEETFETLLAVYQRGVDLNTAHRSELYTLPNLSYADVDAILAYRDEAGFIVDPSVLVINEVISDRKFLAIAPFLLIRDPEAGAFATDGWVRVQTRWSAEDDAVPPIGLRTRVATLKHLTLGAVAMITRDRLDDVVYDPNRDALSAEAPGTQVRVPKVFARWEDDKVDVIAGTYRIGFGQRLVFDNSGEYAPNGIYFDDELFRDTDLVRECKESAGELAESPCSGTAGDIYITPDFRWREGLRGAAGGFRRLEVGPGELQLYGFASHETHDVYQYAIYERADRDGDGELDCDDPRDDGNPACGAPDVYHRPGGGASLDPQSRFSFSTLPRMYNETLGGGNVTYFAGRRSHFGITGYGATVDWLTEGIDLDFQEWESTPFGGNFGAVGLDVAWGHAWADLFIEAAQSFDNQAGGGGGTAAIIRGTGTWGKREVETVFRYYDTDFANPFARPISAPDEYDGLRARDEVGGRVRYTGEHKKKLRLRANADFWLQPSVKNPKTLLFLRADVDVNDLWGWGVWTEYQNKDLSNNGRGSCYEGYVGDDEDGEPLPCGGEKYKLTGRLRYTPDKRATLSAQYTHELVDDTARMSSFRQDISAWLVGTFRPAPEFRVRTRFRYLFEDIEDNGRLEQSLWSYIDLTYKLARKNRFRLRYDLFIWLDDRANTADRLPSPEHWLWAEIETKF